jgi:hypothetical protein
MSTSSASSTSSALQTATLQKNNSVIVPGDNVRIYNSKGGYVGPGVVIGTEESNSRCDECVIVEHFTTYRIYRDVFNTKYLEKIKK